MTKFTLNGSIIEDDFAIHVVDNTPDENDVVLDRVENHLLLSGPDLLTMEMIHKK